MVELETLLSAAIVASVAINAMTSLYVMRRLRPVPPLPVVPATAEQEGAEEEDDEEEDEEESGHPLKGQIQARRAQLIRELEEQRGSRVITLIHRKEPWSTDDEEPEIVLEETETVLQRVRETPRDKPIDFILHTEGGLAFAADLMAMALKHHPGKVTVMVPFYAMSSGTYLALAADEIMMEKYSILAPVEPTIDDMPANGIMAILKRKPVETIADRTILLTEKARMELENAGEFVKWLLADKMAEDQAAQVASFLVGGFMATTTPITLDVARAIGLNVIEGVPEKVHQLFETIEFGGGVKPGKAYQ